MQAPESHIDPVQVGEKLLGTTELEISNVRLQNSADSTEKGEKPLASGELKISNAPANNFDKPNETTEEVLSTTEMEISNLPANNSDKRIENRSNLVSPLRSNMNMKASKRKRLSSTEVTNALFAEFEQKLVQTLSQFNVDSVAEMQKTRSLLRSKNEKLEETIASLERQLGSANLASYLIKCALDPLNDEITGSETIDAIRDQYQQYKYENAASQHIEKETTSTNCIETNSGLEDSPGKVVAKTVKRLHQSSIIKLPSNVGEKTTNDEEEALVEDDKTEQNDDYFTFTDAQLKQFLDQIIETAELAIDHKDQSIIQNKSKGRKSLHDKIQNETSTSKKNRPPFLTSMGNKRATRRSNDGKLVNPLKYPICQLCPASFYNEKDLHQHYVKKHPSINETNGTFGVDVTDEQSTTKCHLCGHVANSADDLHIHKSHHVNPAFCAHKCNKCDLKFCLKTELDIHRKMCNAED